MFAVPPAKINLNVVDNAPDISENVHKRKHENRTEAQREDRRLKDAEKKYIKRNKLN